MQKSLLLLLFFIVGITITNAQSVANPMFENLPVGKYGVGFKIVTLIDDSRIDKPVYNYFGEKQPATEATVFLFISGILPNPIQEKERLLTVSTVQYEI